MIRKPLTKKIRFEVFKRDSFTCQYCGEAAPKVVLNVDHITPVAAGGNNNALNLITACFECNSGKSDRLLSDESTVAKQANQARLLSEKREQLKMMSEWALGMKSIADEQLDVFIKYLSDNYGYELTANGKIEAKKIVRKYSIPEIIEATEKSASQYLKDPNNQADCEKFFKYIVKICYWQKRERENPEEGQIRKIAYTANRLWWSCNVHTLTHRLIELHKVSGIEIPDLMQMVKSSSGIMAFDKNLDKYFELNKAQYE
jgi:hypothetical protein